MTACESGELICLALDWWNFFVIQVAFALATVWAVISRYVPFANLVVDRAAAGVNYLFSWLGERERLQAFGTLAGITFGIYKWWYNRENMLMRRMLDVLRDRDRRLGNIRQDAVSAITTPGPNVKHTVPLFVVGKLQKVLRRRRWLPLLRTQKLPTVTDRALQKAAARLNKLIGAAEKIAASRRSELFSAHMLQGALASARSERYPKSELQAAQNNIARRHFEQALGIPGFGSDRIARECLGVQFMKLREFDKAVEIFDALEEGEANLDEHVTAVLAGRAAYFLGLCAAKTDAPKASTNANGHLIRAVGYLEPQGPFSDVRQQFHFARTHELHACVRGHLGFSTVEAVSLTLAQESYDALRNNPALSGRFSDYLFWFWPTVQERRQGNREILREVDAALKRIEERQSGQRVCVCGKSHPD